MYFYFSNGSSAEEKLISFVLLFFYSSFMNVNVDASHHLEIEKVLQVNTQLLQII